MFMHEKITTLKKILACLKYCVKNVWTKKLCHLIYACLNLKKIRQSKVVGFLFDHKLFYALKIQRTIQILIILALILRYARF